MNNASRASTPPADAPMPTIGKRSPTYNLLDPANSLPRINPGGAGGIRPPPAPASRRATPVDAAPSRPEWNCAFDFPIVQESKPARFPWSLVREPRRQLRRSQDPRALSLQAPSHSRQLPKSSVKKPKPDPWWPSWFVANVPSRADKTNSPPGNKSDFGEEGEARRRSSLSKTMR